MDIRWMCYMDFTYYRDIHVPSGYPNFRWISMFRIDMISQRRVQMRGGSTMTQERVGGCDLLSISTGKPQTWGSEIINLGDRLFKKKPEKKTEFIGKLSTWSVQNHILRIYTYSYIYMCVCVSVWRKKWEYAALVIVSRTQCEYWWIHRFIGWLLHCLLAWLFWFDLIWIDLTIGWLVRFDWWINLIRLSHI